MPSAECYASAVLKESTLLPQLAKYIDITIPALIKMGRPSHLYPYPFSIYKWLPGKSLNLVRVENQTQLAYDMAKFLKQLNSVKGLEVGESKGRSHPSIYDEDLKLQVEKIVKIDPDLIDSHKALEAWDKACATKWDKEPVIFHGDFAVGNILIQDDKLSAVIDFGGCAIGDPACDLVIAWTYFTGEERGIFIDDMNFDYDTWLRARAWVFWKATFELCKYLDDFDCVKAEEQKRVIGEVMTSIFKGY